MNSIACATQRIRLFIAGSDVPEDPVHADNTLTWLLRMRPDAGDALRIAALSHDIDRASPDKILRRDFDDYDVFKAAHARHGAQILKGILLECDVDLTVIAEACRLVELHEVGGDPDADLLKDADSLSYFDTNLPLYLQREGYEEALRRSIWGMRRLSPTAMEYLAQMPHANRTAQQVITMAQKSLMESIGK